MKYGLAACDGQLYILCSTFTLKFLVLLFLYLSKNAPDELAKLSSTGVSQGKKKINGINRNLWRQLREFVGLCMNPS